MNQDGNLSIEASLIIPIFVLYFVLIITIGMFIYKNGTSRLNKNIDSISEYEPNFTSEKINIQL